MTISGQTSVTVSEIDQKELHLRHGRLSASVTWQSADRPMLIYTPTAELKVVGTQFNLDAKSSATILAVNEGLVRLKRLTDGQVVDVPANHQTVASNEGQNGLEVTSRNAVTHSWRSDLAKDATYGKWWSDLHALAVKLKKAVISGKMAREEAETKLRAAANVSDEAGILYAMPWLARQAKADTEADVSYLAVLSVTSGQAIPVVADAGSRFRIVGQVESSTNVTFGITTLARNGGFAGKYSAVRTIEFSEPDGSFDIEIPLLEFQPVVVNTELVESPSHQELADWWCITTGKDVKFAIRRVELLPAMSP